MTAIQKVKNLNKVTLDELMGSLMTHERNIKVDEEKTKKKRSISFKSKIEEEESEDSSDGHIALITRKFMKKKKDEKRKSFKKGGGRKDFNKKEEIICYKCNKAGHFRSECPNLSKFVKRKENKKATLVAWGESDLSFEDKKEENEVANLCLIAKEDSDEEMCLKNLIDGILIVLVQGT